MGVVICDRCGKYIDLDYNVEDAVVLADGMSWACFDCLEEHEINEETGNPIWDEDDKK